MTRGVSSSGRRPGPAFEKPLLVTGLGKANQARFVKVRPRDDIRTGNGASTDDESALNQLANRLGVLSAQKVLLDIVRLDNGFENRIDKPSVEIRMLSGSKASNMSAFIGSGTNGLLGV